MNHCFKNYLVNNNLPIEFVYIIYYLRAYVDWMIQCQQYKIHFLINEIGCNDSQYLMQFNITFRILHVSEC